MNHSSQPGENDNTTKTMKLFILIFKGGKCNRRNPDNTKQFISLIAMAFQAIVLGVEAY